MDKKRILKKLEELYSVPEVLDGFPSQQACVDWANKVAPLLKFNNQYYVNFIKNSHKLNLQVSLYTLVPAFNIMKSQIQMAIEELKIEMEEENKPNNLPKDSKQEKSSNLINMFLVWYKSKNINPAITAAWVGALVGGFFLIWAAYIQSSPSSSGKISLAQSTEASLSSFNVELEVLKKQAKWNYEDGGDRRSYTRLLSLQDTEKDSLRKGLILSAIQNVEDSYRSDIMTINLDRFQLICKPHVNCLEGYEPSIGFDAGNVLSHLSSVRRFDERERAACLLRNIKTASNKDNVDKNTLFEKLAFHMKKENENSLGVSKMALETYKSLTGFSSIEVFDFDGAIEDWQKRKTDILKIKF